MKLGRIFIAAGLILVGLPLLKATRRRKTAAVVQPLKMRNDDWGQGHFGAPRGSRTHAGIDLVVVPGQLVYAPISGRIKRYATPYAGEEYSGLVIQGDAPFEGIEIKIFYMSPSIAPGAPVVPGTVIGQAQAISERYGITMKDHVHVEMRVRGKLVDPAPLILNA